MPQETAPEQTNTVVPADANEPAGAAGGAAGVTASDDRVVKTKLVLAAELVAEAQGRLGQAIELMRQVGSIPEIAFRRGAVRRDDGSGGSPHVVEGVFDGQEMIGPDGKHYAVPANYASKSKLVEGDLLKLVITERGAFVYKQIGPIARRRLRGMLVRLATGHEYGVKVDDRTYRILTASVTYFRGHEGDEVAVLVPETGESKWAAVENIIRAGEPELVPPSDVSPAADGEGR